MREYLRTLAQRITRMLDDPAPLDLDALAKVFLPALTGLS